MKSVRRGPGCSAAEAALGAVGVEAELELVGSAETTTVLGVTRAVSIGIAAATGRASDVPKWRLR